VNFVLRSLSAPFCLLLALLSQKNALHHFVVLPRFLTVFGGWFFDRVLTLFLIPATPSVSWGPTFLTIFPFGVLLVGPPPPPPRFFFFVERLCASPAFSPRFFGPPHWGFEVVIKFFLVPRRSVSKSVPHSSLLPSDLFIGFAFSFFLLVDEVVLGFFFFLLFFVWPLLPPAPRPLFFAQMSDLLSLLDLFSPPNFGVLNSF